jgi:hypothetical protein
LCTLAKYAALTTRNDTIRNREISSPAEELEDVPELNGAYIGYFDDKVAAAVVFANLNADDCSLLHQHFYEDKTVQELALERGIPWTTMRSRLDGVILRARTIMDDKSCRRRALGASTLAWAMFFCRQVYAQVLESWSKSKRMVSATAFGFVAGGAVVAVLVASSSNCGVSTSAAYASTYASASGATRSDVIAAASVMPVSRHVEVGVSPAFESCVVAPFLAMPITTNVTKPPSTSNSVRVNDVEDRSRGLIPWGVNASMRDVSKQK